MLSVSCTLEGGGDGDGNLYVEADTDSCSDTFGDVKMCALPPVEGPLLVEVTADLGATATDLVLTCTTSVPVALDGSSTEGPFDLAVQESRYFVLDVADGTEYATVDCTLNGNAAMFITIEGESACSEFIGDPKTCSFADVIAPMVVEIRAGVIDPGMGLTLTCLAVLAE